MTYDRSYFRMVGLALLPALGVSVVVLVGQFLNVSESTVDRVSQVLFFPTFFAACHYYRPRVRSTHSHASRMEVD